MNLSERAMLAKLTLTAWTARRMDKKATQEVLDNHHASEDAGRFTKALVARDALKALQQLDDEIRREHYRLTLPWMDDGARILPAKAFFQYRENMHAYTDKREQLVADLTDRYPALVDDARRRLNGLFNEAEYPTSQEVAKRYTFTVNFAPLPSGEDFRVNLDDEQVAAIKEQIEQNTKAAVSAGMRDAWQRLYDVVSHAADRLSDPKAIFRDSLIGNIKDICGLLPALNVTDDPNLEAMRQSVEHSLVGLDPQGLRDSDRERARAAQDARELQQTIGQQLATLDAPAGKVDAMLGMV